MILLLSIVCFVSAGVGWFCLSVSGLLAGCFVQGLVCILVKSVRWLLASVASVLRGLRSVAVSSLVQKFFITQDNA